MSYVMNCQERIGQSTHLKLGHYTVTVVLQFEFRGWLARESYLSGLP